MKQAFLGCLMSMLVFTGCDNTQGYDLNKDPLRGKIGGENWEYNSGNGSYDGFNRAYISGLLLSRGLEDPCAIRFETEPHILLTIPPQRGTYYLPSPINNDYSVRFYISLQDGERMATSGFIEIVSVSSTEIIGYLSANFDDDNTVQGSFVLRICQ